MGLSAQPTASPDLSGMTKAQLLQYADDNGIGGVDNSMLKADIYNNIINQL